MQSLALFAPLLILFPSVGAFINFFWGARLGERYSAIIGSVCSGATFFVALVLLSYLSSNNFQPAIVNPPFLDGWLRIESAGLEIAWQQRIDTLAVSMLMFVTFVGTLIHIYAAGYMHGDPRFPRFFAYLNMFLAFMLILITGNNFLMMFVGWEGVGLCSYLLIGFWWDKPKGEGWKNSNAARKAMIANRVGDFGVLMAIFLIFWTFGTLDYYKPTEVANIAANEHQQHLNEEAEHAAAEGETGEGATTTDEHGEEGAPTEEHNEGEEGGEEDHESSSGVVLASVNAQDDHGEGEGEAAEEHGEEAGAAEEHGETTDAEHAEGDTSHGATAHLLTSNDHLAYVQMGAFNKALMRVELAEGETFDDGRGNLIGRQVTFGNFSMDISTVLVLITLFLLLGATGKSAQIPLFVWLPDAMAGPTPVSALIHAATMVTAGVYMMVRSNVFFYHATIGESDFQIVQFIVTLVGGSTAIVAGFIAMGQWDIKRVLAYSTVSQLGFMVAAVGVGAYVAAMFHMITHAFFKALLFLGSGSVIHGMEHGHHHLHEHHDGDHHDEHGDEAHHDGDHEEEAFDPQDMRYMGGLRKTMPLTFWTYLIGTLALAGIWPLAGFWSKDEILADSWLVGLEQGKANGFIALALLLPAAGLTAFYMWRQMELVFFGKPRHAAAEHASDGGWQMTAPLVILAFFSIFVGFINIPDGLASPFVLFLDGRMGLHGLGHFLEFSIAEAHGAPPFQPLIAGTALALGLGAIFFARSIYGHGKALNANGHDPLQDRAGVAPFWKLSNARLYWDEAYDRLFIKPFTAIANFIANVIDWNFLHNYFHDTIIWKGFTAVGQFLGKPFDLGIIDGFVNGVGRLVRATSGVLRQSQTGYVRVYAVALLLGVVAVVVIMLLPMLQR